MYSLSSHKTFFSNIMISFKLFFKSPKNTFYISFLNPKNMFCKSLKKICFEIWLQLMELILKFLKWGFRQKFFNREEKIIFTQSLENDIRDGREYKKVCVKFMRNETPCGFWSPNSHYLPCSYHHTGDPLVL